MWILLCACTTNVLPDSIIFYNKTYLYRTRCGSNFVSRINIRYLTMPFCEIRAFHFPRNNCGIKERRTISPAPLRRYLKPDRAPRTGGLEMRGFLGGTSVIQTILYISLKSLPTCQCQTAISPILRKKRRTLCAIFFYCHERPLVPNPGQNHRVLVNSGADHGMCSDP